MLTLVLLNAALAQTPSDDVTPESFSCKRQKLGQLQHIWDVCSISELKLFNLSLSF